MTPRQKILKAVYPVLMWFSKSKGQKNGTLSNPGLPPVVPFYSLQAFGIDGKKLDLEYFKGKKVLLVNTASDCGYTAQYEALEKLYQSHKEKLAILGFPSNDFKEQEKGTDQEIAAFCKSNFGITFPLLKKCTVLKGTGQNEIFEWLSNKEKNGWSNQAPTWNFCKYLVDENGVLKYFFPSSVDPMSDTVLKAIGE